MQLMGCGYFSYPLLYMFFLAVFQTIREMLLVEIIDPDKNSLDDWHYFFATFFMFFGNIVGGSAHFIYLNCIKPKKIQLDQFNMNDSNSNGISKIEFECLIIQRKEKSNICNLILYVLLMSSMDYIGYTLIALGNSSSNLKVTTKMFQIIFTSLFSYFILSYSVYRHQYLSIGIILFGIAFNYTFIGVNVKEDKDGWKGIAEISISYVILSLKNTLEKYVMKRHFCEPLKLLFYEGVFGIAISTIANAALYFILDDNNKYFKTPLFTKQLDVFFKQNYMLYIALFFNFTCSIFINVFIFLINFACSPTHLGIAYAFSTVFVSIAGFIPTSKKFEFSPDEWAYLGSYLFFNLGSIIYNEIIIINICKLNEYTKDQIHRRSRNEITNNMIEIARADHVEIDE